MPTKLKFPVEKRGELEECFSQYLLKRFPMGVEDESAREMKRIFFVGAYVFAREVDNLGSGKTDPKEGGVRLSLLVQECFAFIASLSKQKIKKRRSRSASTRPGPGRDQ